MTKELTLDREGLQRLLANGVSKTLMARLLGVSKPTLVRWLGGQEPLSDSMTRDANRTIAKYTGKGAQP